MQTAHTRIHFIRQVRRSSSSLQRTVFEAYVHAVRRQRQSRVLFGTLSNRRGTTIEHCTLYEWHRKVKLYNVVRQRCKMRGWRLVTRIFHLWLRSALYTALMRKARHMMHEVHHIQVQEFATRRAHLPLPPPFDPGPARPASPRAYNSEHLKLIGPTAGRTYATRYKKCGKHQPYGNL